VQAKARPGKCGGGVVEVVEAKSIATATASAGLLTVKAALENPSIMV